MLVAMAAAPASAGEAAAQKRDLALAMGFAIGAGLVDRSDSEIAALQFRLQFRSRRLYAALRNSWVAQSCSSRPNPKELSLVAGVSLPLESERRRIEIGAGIGRATVHGDRLASLPCEWRLKLGAFALTAFANFNRRNSFLGFCAGFDFRL
jgi:hypothetical protein